MVKIGWKIFQKFLRENKIKTINFKKKLNKVSTNEQQDPYENAKICYIFKETFKDKHTKANKYKKIRNHCCYTCEYKSAVHSICNLKYSKPKEITIIFHNGSTHDYHIVIKDLAAKFEGQFTCLGKNTEKYIIFRSNKKIS